MCVADGCAFACLVSTHTHTHTHTLLQDLPMLDNMQQDQFGYNTKELVDVSDMPDTATQGGYIQTPQQQQGGMYAAAAGQ